MKKLLEFIMNYCDYLIYDHGFKFIDSNATRSFDNATVVLGNKALQISVTKDREQISFSFKGAGKKAQKNYWKDDDLIKNYILNKDKYVENKNTKHTAYSFDSSLIVAIENASFIKNNIDEITTMFSDDNIDETMKRLNTIANQRSKLMFK